MEQHINYATSVTSMFTSIVRNRRLIFQLARREVIGRYQGSMMGLMWSFLNPIFMLIVYTIFFSVFLKARWSISGEETHADYSIILFIGLILNGLFSECVSRAPTLIVSNANYVKKVVSPLEIFPCIAVLSALFHVGVSIAVLLIAQIILNHWLSWSLIFFPIVILPFIFLILGLTWFLAALGVYIRDIAQLTVVFTTVMLFMSPVFFPIASLPARIQPWLLLNPLTFIVEQSRNIFFHAALPDWTGLGIYSLVSLTIAWLGFWWFQKTREGFADVL